MSYKDSASRYLRRLFNDSDHVCLSTDLKGNAVYPLPDVLARLEAGDPTPNFVSLNPLDGTTDRMPVQPWHRADAPRRADVNVTEHRNFLIEFDGMTLEQQSQELLAKAVPYTSLVYSGGKSLHAVIALTESVTREEYDQLFKYLRYILWQCDPSCRNPSRLTRVAGADRDGVEQSLVDLRKRVTKEQLMKWLARFSAHIERCEQREREAEAARRLVTSEAGELSTQTLAFLEGEVGTKGSRHARLVAAAFELMEAGKEFDESLALIEKAADLHGVTADPARAGEGLQIVNYVYGRRRK